MPRARPLLRPWEPLARLGPCYWALTPARGSEPPKPRTPPAPRVVSGRPQAVPGAGWERPGGTRGAGPALCARGQLGREREAPGYGPPGFIPRRAEPRGPLRKATSSAANRARAHRPRCGTSRGEGRRPPGLKSPRPRPLAPVSDPALRRRIEALPLTGPRPSSRFPPPTAVDGGAGAVEAGAWVPGRRSAAGSGLGPASPPPSRRRGRENPRCGTGPKCRAARSWRGAVPPGLRPGTEASASWIKAETRRDRAGGAGGCPGRRGSARHRGPRVRPLSLPAGAARGPAGAAAAVPPQPRPGRTWGWARERLRSSSLGLDQQGRGSAKPRPGSLASAPKRDAWALLLSPNPGQMSLGLSLLNRGLRLHSWAQTHRAWSLLQAPKTQSPFPSTGQMSPVSSPECRTWSLISQLWTWPYEPCFEPPDCMT